MTLPPFDQIRVGVVPIDTWSPAKADCDLFRYVDIGSVDRETKSIVSVADVPVEEAPSRARQLLRASDVLVSTVRPNLNAVALVPKEFDGSIASTGFTVLRPNPTKLDPRFLFHWVRTPSFVSDMVKKATGASYPAVSDRIVLDSVMPMPAPEEQRRIADILDKADAIRRKRKEAIALTDELLRSTFLEMFGDPVTNPKGWPIQLLGELAEVGGGPQVSHAREANPRILPYLRVANVFRDRLDLTEIKEIRVTDAEYERVLLRRGDVLVVEGHGNPDELGRSAVWRSEIAPCTHQNHLIRIRASLSSVIPEYLSSFLNSSAGRAQMLRMGKTTSGLNTISTNNVRGVHLPLPPLGLQTCFADAEARLRAMTARSESALAECDLLFESLATRAFSGHLQASAGSSERAGHLG